MSPIPPPVPSPRPPGFEPEDLDTPSGVHKAVAKTARQTQLQWAAIGSVALAVFTGLAWNYDLFTSLAVGNAEANARSKAADDRSAANERRIDAVDSGVNAKLERMEKKQDAEQDRNERFREEQRAFRQELLKKLEKR